MVVLGLSCEPLQITNSHNDHIFALPANAKFCPGPVSSCQLPLQIYKLTEFSLK